MKLVTTTAVFVTLLCATSLMLAQGRSFDGKWWVSVSSEERRGFLAGYLDCYVDDQKHAVTFDKSWAEYERLIMQRYAKRAAASDELVVSILLQFGKPSHKALVRPHEDFGDEWWRQDSKGSRTGFVEGYIACRQMGPRGPRWSRPTAYYVERLNDLYNADDRHGLDAPEYAGSIASALAKLADGATATR